MDNQTNKCKCNFCLKEYEFDCGYFIYGKYFVCDHCLDVFSVLSEITLDKELITEEEISGTLMETDLEAMITNAQTNGVNVKLMKGTEEKEVPRFPYPTEIKGMLDQYIIGQDKAKKVISTAVYNHYIRVVTHRDKDIELPKSNIILIGGTGVGKTYLVETIARILGVPFISVDCTGLTPSGWKGNNVDTILSSLIVASQGNKEIAERGIVYLDEIDKLMIGRLGTSGGDINGRGVQQSLLKMVEGGMILTELPNKSTVEVNTKNILFIGGGAFNGLDKVIEKRLGVKKKGIGFNHDAEVKKVKYTLHDVIHEDMIQYGFIPEFMGRFPVISALNDLTPQDLFRILTEPTNALTKQYINLLAYSNIIAGFDQELLNQVVNKAIKQNTGARALKTVMENVMQDYMYTLPSGEEKECLITHADYVADESKEL